jgi:hypothetical protein
VEHWGILHPFGSPGISNLTPVTSLPALALQPIELQLAPNPFRDRVSISCELPLAGVLAFELYDLNGRLMRRIDAGERLPGPQMITTSLGELPPGLYTVRALLNREVVANGRWVKL